MNCLFHRIFLTTCLLFNFVSQTRSESREWVDSTGAYSVKGTLIAYDATSIILKVDQKANPKSPDLVSMPLDKLSEQDRAYLNTKEAKLALDKSGQPQRWTMKNGMTIVGQVVGYGRKDVTIQRRRGKVYVNDRLLTTLPEIYQRFIPKIIEHFDQVQLPDAKAFDEWMIKQKATPRTFHCEGVSIELENGEEYSVPFFFFTDEDNKLLQPGWEQWLTYQTDHERQEKENFYLQSQAIAYQQQQAQDRQFNQRIAMMQVELLAVNAGATSMWEVYLEPPFGVRGYPQNVVITARDSDQASLAALRKFPGYVVVAVSKIAGRHR